MKVVILNGEIELTNWFDTMDKKVQVHVHAMTQQESTYTLIYSVSPNRLLG